MINKTIRILIGSCGGLTGMYLTKQLKSHNNFNKFIYGIDASYQNATRLFLDKFIQSPRVDQKEAFINFIIDLCNNEEIDIYLPTYSKEIRLISEYEEVLRSKTKTNFIVSDYSSYEKLENKSTFGEYISKYGLKSPRIYNGGNVTYPSILKPAIGSGSNNTFILENNDDYNYYLNKYKSSVVTEYVSGTEYTIDVICDFNSEVVAYNQRVREKVSNGAVVISKNDFSIEIIDKLKPLIKDFRLKGVINFQFILHNGTIYFIDINLRYASGGLPLTVSSGIDVIQILIDLLLNGHIEHFYKSDKKNRTMFRYFEEVFEV